MNADSVTSLLYFLALGFFFYWMMKRGGCGMHSHGEHGTHGGHGHGGEHPTRTMAGAPHADVMSASARDPVCGMDVDPQGAAGMRLVTGQRFYFCSAKCLAAFDSDPERFTRKAASEEASKGHEHHGRGCH